MWEINEGGQYGERRGKRKERNEGGREEEKVGMKENVE